MKTQHTADMANTMTLLDRLKNEMPEIWGQAQVVGKWVWLEFNVPPVGKIRENLKRLGFHWNGQRKCWQHPCGVPSLRADGDPRSYYQVKPANELEMKDAPPPAAKEYKVVALRECPLPESLRICETPDNAADYWRLHVATNPYFNPECECLVVLMLNTRRRVKGHQLVTIGTMDMPKVVAGRSKKCMTLPDKAANPSAALAGYLMAVHEEAVRRGYRFDASKIGARRSRGKLTETRGQLLYEWRHLKRKLKRRDVKRYRDILPVKIPAPHPLFRIVPGKVRDWEKGR
jgi:hypothetical protein